MRAFDVDLTLRNYRCFGPEPVTLPLRDGFTALVGLNNGGKSTLLRALFELRPLFNPGYLPSTAAGANHGGWFFPAYTAAGERVWPVDGSDDMEVRIRIRAAPPESVTADTGRFEYCFRYERGGGITGWLELDGQDASSLAGQMQQPLADVLPVLTNAMYLGPFRNIISPGGGQYYDLTMGQAFISQFRAFKTGPDPVANEAVVTLQDELARIFNFDRLDINASEDTTTLQVAINGRSFRLSELGAGISHFIAVMINVLVRKPDILLVDEPELNLHASLQLDFLTTLGRMATHGVLFATHNLSLARSAADEVLVVHHQGRPQVSPYTAGTTFAAVAAQLSLDGTPDVGYEKVCLVEGKSDVRAVMQMLRLYGAEHRVALIPMGGGELLAADIAVELAELQRLGPVTYLIDSERTSPGSDPAGTHVAFMAAASRLGIEGHMLERRALENYYTQRAVTAALGAHVKSLGPFEKFSGGTGWRKTHGWKIAAELMREELEASDLGGFLSAL